MSFNRIACPFTIHKECLAAIGVDALKNCKGKQIHKEKVAQTEFDEHSWQVETLTKPTYCQHCDEFIFGFSNQALKCKSRNDVESSNFKNVRLWFTRDVW